MNILLLIIYPLVDDTHALSAIWMKSLLNSAQVLGENLISPLQTRSNEPPATLSNALLIASTVIQCKTVHRISCQTD